MSHQPPYKPCLQEATPPVLILVNVYLRVNLKVSHSLVIYHRFHFLEAHGTFSRSAFPYLKYGRFSYIGYTLAFEHAVVRRASVLADCIKDRLET